jgi:voltage-gated potassium channel
MDRRALYQLLEPDSPGREARLFRLVHHLVVAAGIAIMLAETVPALHDDYDLLLDFAFYVAAAFFAAEYVLRLIAAPEAPGFEHYRPWRARLYWAASLPGIFDLVAATPGLIALAQHNAPSLFACVWIFKYVRYSPGLASLERVVSHARNALLSVLLGFAIVLLVAASLAYLLERGANPDAFGSIQAALWWAIVTLTTTGYGDVVPQTVAGRMLAGVVMVSGILVFALWAGILATGYAEEVRRREFLRTWELVAKVPFFRNIGAGLIAEVAQLLRRRDYPEGTGIVRRGERGDCMFFIVDGEVEIELQPQPLYLGPGNFFGEVALLTRAPRNATVSASKPCTLLLLDIVDFHRLLAHHPELARAIRDEAGRRLGSLAPAREAAAPVLAEDEPT